MSAGTCSEFFPDDHLGDITDIYRHAINTLDFDILDIFDTADQSGRAYQIRLAGVFDVPAAGVGVVLGDCLHHVTERQPIGHQFGHIGVDMELLLVTTDAVDFRHAGHCPQLRANDPVLNRSQILLGVLGPIGLGSIGFDRPHIDLAEPG